MFYLPTPKAIKVALTMLLHFTNSIQIPLVASVWVALKLRLNKRSAVIDLFLGTMQEMNIHVILTHTNASLLFNVVCKIIKIDVKVYLLIITTRVFIYFRDWFTNLWTHSRISFCEGTLWE